MIVTTYTCDRCGHSQPTDDQMWTVIVGINSGHYASQMPYKKREALWCRTCVEKLHLMPPHVLKPADLPPPPTLEDMIREIVADEVGSRS